MVLSKAQIREKALTCRQSLSAVERKQKSSQILKTIMATPFFAAAECIMLYLNFRDEVKTTPLAEEILKNGKRLVIPYCETRTTQIIPCEIQDLAKDVGLSSFGIREPLADFFRPVAPTKIDLALVPGLAFDYQGNRIGFGKGYYDRFLPQLRADVCVIGVAFACQVFERIPAESHDYKMSLLVTEDGLFTPS